MVCKLVSANVLLLPSSGSGLNCVCNVFGSYFGLPDISAWEFALLAAEEQQEQQHFSRLLSYVTPSTLHRHIDIRFSDTSFH